MVTTKRLLLSIHDVGPRFESEVDRLRDLLGEYAPVDRIALLVVPNHWDKAPIIPGSPFASRLRDWADQGAEIFVHGFYHLDRSPHRGALTQFKARHMTAGEGEFLGLDFATALERMRAGRSLIEDVIGRSATGFIAPAWLYGPGALAAAAQCGFALAEDHMKVWNPLTQQVLCKGPVLTWASRSRARIASSLLAARALPLLLGRLPVARLGVHPGDIHVPVLVASIGRAVARLMQTHRAGRYADLLDPTPDAVLQHA
ncbi:DUF2334 domain-containing protein [Sphingomonas sp. MMS24-J13]|uniref:DUF2334 domain-containing protein n=1 Tax=Sphingomonas sp. MMS24-J13 TaxID=3238686 RepID=UPI00385102D2